MAHQPGESYVTVEGNAGDQTNLDPWLAYSHVVLRSHAPKNAKCTYDRQSESSRHLVVSHDSLIPVFLRMSDLGREKKIYIYIYTRGTTEQCRHTRPGQLPYQYSRSGARISPCDTTMQTYHVGKESDGYVDVVMEHESEDEVRGASHQAQGGKVRHDVVKQNAAPTSIRPRSHTETRIASLYILGMKQSASVYPYQCSLRGTLRFAGYQQLHSRRRRRR